MRLAVSFSLSLLNGSVCYSSCTKVDVTEMSVFLLKGLSNRRNLSLHHNAASEHV